MSDPEARKDGFRKRRKRPAGWLKQAIKRGEVRDPNAPPETETRPEGHVIDVPLADSGAAGTEE